MSDTIMISNITTTFEDTSFPSSKHFCL